MAVRAQYVDSAQPNVAEWEQVHPDPSAFAAFSACIIFDGNTYSALCPELDIATDADTAEEAYFLLRAAVSEAVAVAKENEVSPGRASSDEDLIAFLSHHNRQTRVPFITRIFHLAL